LACVTMKMTVEEALVASTLNAAYSMGMQETHGSLEIGKHGDIVIVDAPRWEHIIYQFGGLPPLYAVIKNGVVKYPNKGSRSARHSRKRFQAHSANEYDGVSSTSEDSIDNEHDLMYCTL